MFAGLNRGCDDECMSTLHLSAVASNVVMPRRPATAMDHVIKENVVQPPMIRPKPLPVTGATGVTDQVRSSSASLMACFCS